MTRYPTPEQTRLLINLCGERRVPVDHVLNLWVWTLREHTADEVRQVVTKIKRTYPPRDPR